jgi:hypothetical protein
LALYAPWVRKIFIVTDDQKPEWLVEDEKVQIVDHTTIFPSGTRLPTFNSHAIETALHRIPGLSEHFIYFNDDVFCTSPVRKIDFFTSTGLSKISFSKKSMPIGPEDERLIASEWGGMNTAKLFEKKFSTTCAYKVKHIPFSMSITSFSQMEIEFQDIINQVQNTQFRSPHDYAPISSLYLNYCLLKGTAVEYPIHDLYINTSKTHAFKDLLQTHRENAPKILCLNDDSGCQSPDIQRFLQYLFPWKSPWER